MRVDNFRTRDAAHSAALLSTLAAGQKSTRAAN
jgi:hypothetical protein